MLSAIEFCSSCLGLTLNSPENFSAINGTMFVNLDGNVVGEMMDTKEENRFGLYVLSVIASDIRRHPGRGKKAFYCSRAIHHS